MGPYPSISIMEDGSDLEEVLYIFEGPLHLSKVPEGLNDFLNAERFGIGADDEPAIKFSLKF